MCAAARDRAQPTIYHCASTCCTVHGMCGTTYNEMQSAHGFKLVRITKGFADKLTPFFVGRHASWGLWDS